MIPDELEVLLLADAVGALDPDERVELLARLEALGPEQQSEVARVYNAAAAVARRVAPVDPPATLRQRVLDAARQPTRYTVWAADAVWVDTGLPGIRARVLAVDQARSLVTLVIRAEPGAVYPSHKHHGPEECFVISGSVVIDGRGPARRRFPPRGRGFRSRRDHDDRGRRRAAGRRGGRLPAELKFTHEAAMHALMALSDRRSCVIRRAVPSSTRLRAARSRRSRSCCCSRPRRCGSSAGRR